MQVFFWIGPSTQRNNRTYYQQFQLNGTTYAIGESVYLFPENENHPHYIGRIVSAFVDEHSGHADPHCIEVKWYERRVNLEESTRGIEESEREVFELEDVDINPIGCISGKNVVVKARAYDEAYQRMRGVTDTDWYFCRGYFMQSRNAFEPYSAEELAANPHTEMEEQESAAQSQPAASTASREKAQAGQKRKATGRVCVQCGATSTPQWREGPTGPKTLCNACGVRYGRAQAKAQKKAGQATAGASSRAPAAGGGRGGGAGGGGRGKKASKEADGAVGSPGAKTETQRPLRQAAQASLARTAAYARTGEFPDEEYDPAVESAENGAFSASTQLPIAALEIPPAVSAFAAALPPGGAADDSLPAEGHGSEVRNSTCALPGAPQHWGVVTPTRATRRAPHLPALLTAAAAGLPTSPAVKPFSPSQLPGIVASDLCSVLELKLPLTDPVTVRPTTIDGDAAPNAADSHPVDQLQQPQDQLQEKNDLHATREHPALVLRMQTATMTTPCAASSAPLLPPMSQTAPPATTHGSYQQLATEAAQHLPELNMYLDLFAALDTLPPGALPPELSVVLEQLRQQVSAANKGAAVAEAAVMAVARVYAEKRAHTEQARVLADQAGKHLQEFMTSVVEPGMSYAPMACEKGSSGVVSIPSAIPEVSTAQAGVVAHRTGTSDMVEAGALSNTDVAPGGQQQCDAVTVA